MQRIEFADRLRTVGDIQFFEESLHMVFNGEGADVQNGADFGVGFTQGNPTQHFGLPQGYLMVVCQACVNEVVGVDGW